MSEVKKVKAKAGNLMKNGKFTKAIDEYMEKAKDFREKGKFKVAIQLAELGRDLAREKCLSYDGSFCERQLCEIYAILGNRDKSLEHAANFRRLAFQSSISSQKQLSHHVTAWCIEKLFDKGVVGILELEKALEHIGKSKNYLEQNEESMEKFKTHGTVAERMLGLQNLEAQIYQLLGNERKALQVLTEAEDSLTKELKHMKYELILTKIGLSAVKDRLKLSEKLLECAPIKKKGNAFLENSHQLVVNNKFDEGYIKLREVYCSKKYKFEKIDQDDIQNRLPILFKIFKYKQHLESQSQSHLSKCQIYEAIADLYDQYYRPFSDKEKKEYSEFARTNIVNNYLEMISFKRDVKDELRALNGIALVFIDMENYAEAKKYFEKRLELLETNEMKINDIMDVKLSLFQCDCKLGTEGVTKMFSELENCLTFSNHLRELFDIWSTYCGTVGERKLEQVYREKSAKIEEILVKNEDDETDILFGHLENEEILKMCREEYKKQEEYEKMIKNKNEKNKNGETALHEASKESNSEKVEMLCKLGYDVNAKDYGGWTPLFEAVTYEQIDNVRILLKYKANVNYVSDANVENMHSNSRQSESNCKITPLMDACCNGFVDIAKLLIDNEAILEIRDSVGWTAFNHLENYIKEHGADDGQSEFLEFLRGQMTDKNISLKPIKVRRKSSPPMKFNNDDYDMEIDDKGDDDCVYIQTTSSANRIRKRPCSEQFENTAKRCSNSFSKPHSLPSQSPSQLIRLKSPITPPQKFGTIVDLYQTPQRRSIERVLDEMIVVILIFDAPEQFDKMKIQFSKTSEIRDIKNKIFEDERKKKFPKITIYEKTQSGDRFELNDDFKLSMSENNEITLVCKLSPLNAFEMYRNNVKDPINEVCQRLENLTTNNVLNLSHLFLNSKQFAKIFDVLRYSELPDELVLDLSRCDLSTQDELALRVFSKSITSLTMHASKSTTNFELLFKSQFSNLKTIEISNVEVRDQSSFSNILSNDKLEKVSLIHLQCRCIESSPIIERLIKIDTLTYLDMSGTKWTSESDWCLLLSNLKKVRQLNMNDIETMVELDAEWLPQLNEIQLRRSKLNWESFLVWLSTASTVTKIDLRASIIDVEFESDLNELKSANNLVILQ